MLGNFNREEPEFEVDVRPQDQTNQTSPEQSGKPKLSEILKSMEAGVAKAKLGDLRKLRERIIKTARQNSLYREKLDRRRDGRKTLISKEEKNQLFGELGDDDYIEAVLQILQEKNLPADSDSAKKLLEEIGIIEPMAISDQEIRSELERVQDVVSAARDQGKLIDSEIRDSVPERGGRFFSAVGKVISGVLRKLPTAKTAVEASVVASALLVLGCESEAKRITDKAVVGVEIDIAKMKNNLAKISDPDEIAKGKEEIAKKEALLLYLKTPVGQRATPTETGVNKGLEEAKKIFGETEEGIKNLSREFGAGGGPVAPPPGQPVEGPHRPIGQPEQLQPGPGPGPWINPQSRQGSGSEAPLHRPIGQPEQLQPGPGPWAGQENRQSYQERMQGDQAESGEVIKKAIVQLIESTQGYQNLKNKDQAKLYFVRGQLKLRVVGRIVTQSELYSDFYDYTESNKHGVKVTPEEFFNKIAQGGKYTTPPRVGEVFSTKIRSYSGERINERQATDELNKTEKWYSEIKENTRKQLNRALQNPTSTIEDERLGDLQEQLKQAEEALNKARTRWENSTKGNK